MGMLAVALRELIAAGLTGDALVDAIARIEDAATAALQATPCEAIAADPMADPVAERRRIYDRERKRKMRSANAANVHRTSTGQDGNVHRTSTGRPPENSPPLSSPPSFPPDPRNSPPYNPPHTSAADATDGVQPSSVGSDLKVVSPEDLTAALFDSGVPFLKRHGQRESGARALLGKWRKAYGDGAVIDALAVAMSQTSGVSEPVGFITKTLKQRNGKHTSRRPALDAWLEAALARTTLGPTGGAGFYANRDDEIDDPIYSRVNHA